MKEKIERNYLVYCYIEGIKPYNERHSFAEAAREFRFNSKATTYEIWERVKENLSKYQNSVRTT